MQHDLGIVLILACSPAAVATHLHHMCSTVRRGCHCRTSSGSWEDQRQGASLSSNTGIDGSSGAGKQARLAWLLLFLFCAFGQYRTSSMVLRAVCVWERAPHCGAVGSGRDSCWQPCMASCIVQQTALVCKLAVLLCINAKRFAF